MLKLLALSLLSFVYAHVQSFVCGSICLILWKFLYFFSSLFISLIFIKWLIDLNFVLIFSRKIAHFLFLIDLACFFFVFLIPTHISFCYYSKICCMHVINKCFSLKSCNWIWWRQNAIANLHTDTDAIKKSLSIFLFLCCLSTQ